MSPNLCLPVFTRENTIIQQHFLVPEMFQYNPIHLVTCKKNSATRESMSSRKSDPVVKTRVMEQVGTGLRSKT